MEHSDNGLFIKRERFEVLAILREICKQRTPLRVENQQHRFQSLLLSVGPDNIVFSGEEAASAIDGACTIVIESNDAKIEFSVGRAELTEHQGVVPARPVCRRSWSTFSAVASSASPRRTGANSSAPANTRTVRLMSCGSTICPPAASVCASTARCRNASSRACSSRKRCWIWAATAASRSTWSWWWSTTIRKPTTTIRWCTSRACHAASSSWGWRWSAKFRAPCSPSSWISTKEKR